jgi:hypothetical protein
MHRHDAGDHENSESRQPVALYCTDRETQEDVDDVGATDEHQMDEPLIHRLVRREIVALRGRIFEGSVLGHSFLQLGSAPWNYLSWPARAT